MKIKFFITIFATALFLQGATVAQARISYGSGYYTNLCGGGTEANIYTCSNGCNPSQGKCISSTESVVKWTCNGKLNQCGQNESAWVKESEFGQVGCDKTVQISIFDKKCRMADGSWDSSCVLGGYMVWYSGECNGLSPTAGYSATPSASVTVSTTIRPTVRPTIRLSGTPNLTTTPGNATAGGETKGGVTTTPETGPEDFGSWILVGFLAVGGWWLVRYSKRVI